MSKVPPVKQIWVFVETCERNICFLQNLAGRIFVQWMTSIVSKSHMKKPSTKVDGFFNDIRSLRKRVIYAAAYEGTDMISHFAEIYHAAEPYIILRRQYIIDVKNPWNSRWIPWVFFYFSHSCRKYGTQMVIHGRGWEGCICNSEKSVRSTRGSGCVPVPDLRRRRAEHHIRRYFMTSKFGKRAVPGPHNGEEDA